MYAQRVFEEYFAVIALFTFMMSLIFGILLFNYNDNQVKLECYNKKCDVVKCMVEHGKSSDEIRLIIDGWK
jgi:hypothetical protein